MPNIQAEQTINAPIARVYEISQDYSVRYEWDPFPDYLRNLDGGNGMPFVGREVEGRAKSGVFMRVRFVRVKAPEVAAITMVKGPIFLEKFAGSWRFRALSDHQTLARFSYSLSAPAWCAWLLNPLMRYYFSRVVAQRLSGLKRYCEAQCPIGH
ncbi:SRPBCC family protein [Conchiformibius kuhniae]|uniref:SRPBCC family protein n=1 Tax=Conchiformibius kuhniae TaxID=211502 RepID=A0A8T9MT24_9NEIS|nr:SRPBCC family protein [Conchiformibius kuhniae]